MSSKVLWQAVVSWDETLANRKCSFSKFYKWCFCFVNENWMEAQLVKGQMCHFCFYLLTLPLVFYSVFLGVKISFGSWRIGFYLQKPNSISQHTLKLWHSKLLLARWALIGDNNQLTLLINKVALLTTGHTSLLDFSPVIHGNQWNIDLWYFQRWMTEWVVWQ